MGLSASQGRLLSLTARLADLEFRAQNVSNSKLRLADQSELVSKNYLDALNAKKLTAYNINTHTNVDATLNRLYQLNESSPKKRIIVDRSGNLVVPQGYVGKDGRLTSLGETALIFNFKNQKTGDPAQQYDGFIETDDRTGFQLKEPGKITVVDNKYISDTEYLYKMLNDGNWCIYEYDDEGGKDSQGAWDEISWSTGDSTLVTAADQESLARAEAEYETAMSQIQSKDKKFDLELKALDSEHSAVQTEIDSVKKVMDKNIESTFKIFS